MAGLRILIVDDHELTRVGIRALLASRPDWEICGEAIDGDEALDMFERMKPNVVVLELTMAGRNGFEVAEEIRRMVPDAKIVFYSMHSVAATARQVGADEFVSKSSPSQELIDAIERVARKIGAANTNQTKRKNASE